MRAKLQHINLPLAAIIAEGFFSRLSFGVISFALPLYAHHLGLSLTEIGLLASLNTIVAIALKPVMGWAADRYGLKRIFTIAISLRSLVALLLAFAGMPWQLYFIRTTHGLATSLRDPSSNALIAENGGKEAVASAFAWYQTAKSVAGSLGKALAGLLLGLTVANYPIVFLAAFLLSALPLIVVLLEVTGPELIRILCTVGGGQSYVLPTLAARIILEINEARSQERFSNFYLTLVDTDERRK